MTRHFLRDDDLTPAEQAEVLDLAAQVKKDRFGFAGDPSSFVRTRGRGRRAARVAGCRYLEVTSGERPGREAAHAFYDALGLEQVSRRYLKEL